MAEQSEVSTPTESQAPRPPAAAPMGRPGDGMRRGPSSGGRPSGGRGRFGRDFRPRKVCKFCAEKGAKIEYKDIPMLRGFITDRGKMWSARITGLCAWHQRKICVAIKRARIMALLPFATTGN